MTTRGEGAKKTKNKKQLLYLTQVTRLRYLAYAAGPVPHKVVPVPVGLAVLVQDLGHYVAHGHAEHGEGTQVVRQRFLLVGGRAAVLLNGFSVIHLDGEQKVLIFFFSAGSRQIQTIK